MIESNFTQDISALKKLPNSWSVIDFGEVFKDISGGNKKFLKSDFLVEGKVAVVDQGKDLIAGYTNEEDEVVKGLPPYIVFGDHTRIFKFIDFPFVMGADGTKVFKVKDITINDEKYLFHFLNSLNIPNTGYNRHFKYLKSTKIPLPPLTQQQKIANILDAADALRQNNRALITKYDELTQALFLDMFGDPVSNPKKLLELELGNAVELITYGLTVRPEYIENGIPLISAREIRSGKIELIKAPKISQGDFNKLSNKGIPKINDILFSKTGSIGHCALVETTDVFAITQNAARLTFKKTINPIYAMYYLKSSYIQQLSQQRAKGNAVKDLQLGDMKKFKFICPTINTQNQFAERVAVIEEQKAIAQKSLEKSEELFNSLLQKAFKGELV